MRVLVELVKAVLVGEALRLEQQLILSKMNLRFGTELAFFLFTIIVSVAHDSRLLPDVAPDISSDLGQNSIQCSAASLPLSSIGRRTATARHQTTIRPPSV